jgi:hypothetical protein
MSREEVATSSQNLANKCNNHPAWEIVKPYFGIVGINNLCKRETAIPPEHTRSGIERAGVIANRSWWLGDRVRHALRAGPCPCPFERFGLGSYRLIDTKPESTGEEG